MQSESEDNEDVLYHHDAVIPLLRQKANVMGCHGSHSLLELSQSRTMLVDDVHIGVEDKDVGDGHTSPAYQCITASAQQARTRQYKQRLRDRHQRQQSQQRRSPHGSAAAVAVVEELSECEIKLVQSQHERKVLMRENVLLRQQIASLCQQFGVDAKLVDMHSLQHCTKPVSSRSTEEFCLSSSTAKNLSTPSPLLSPSFTSSLSKSDSGDTVVSAFSSNLQFVKSLSAQKSLSAHVDEDVCVSREHCWAVQCMVDALKWYSVHGEQYEQVFSKMKHRGYGERVMNAYNHVISQHLNSKEEYAAIASRVQHNVGDCAFTHCGGQQRYMRSKQSQRHQASTQLVNEIQSYANTMDGIHCCFVHLAKNLK